MIPSLFTHHFEEYYLFYKLASSFLFRIRGMVIDGRGLASDLSKWIVFVRSA